MKYEIKRDAVGTYWELFCDAGWIGTFVRQEDAEFTKECLEAKEAGSMYLPFPVCDKCRKNRSQGTVGQGKTIGIAEKVFWVCGDCYKKTFSTTQAVFPPPEVYEAVLPDAPFIAEAKP